MSTWSNYNTHLLVYNFTTQTWERHTNMRIRSLYASPYQRDDSIFTFAEPQHAYEVLAGADGTATESEHKWKVWKLFDGETDEIGVSGAAATDGAFRTQAVIPDGTRAVTLQKVFPEVRTQSGNSERVLPLAKLQLYVDDKAVQPSYTLRAVNASRGLPLTARGERFQLDISNLKRVTRDGTSYTGLAVSGFEMQYHIGGQER